MVDVRFPSLAKPPAFQTHPSDLELVDSYLRTWVETGVKKGAFIHDYDVYAADPDYLTRRFAPAVGQDGERAWYFYTTVRHKSLHGKRKTRTVATGAGCWHNEAKSKPLYLYCKDGKHRIGDRQSFSFVNKDTGARVRTGWLMIELRLLNRKDGAGKKPEAEEDALGNRVICKVYRSPRNPVPSGSEATAAAAPGHKAEADDDESSDATLDDNVDDDDDVDVDVDDSSDASLAAASGRKRKPDVVESSEATVAAPSRHSKASDEISGGDAAAPGRGEKAEVGEGSAETSAAAPPRKRKKALDDESSGPARKKQADVSTSSGAPVPITEMHCPQCGTHLVLTLKKAESKSETEPIASDEPSPGAPQRGETRAKKNVRFHQFL